MSFVYDYLRGPDESSDIMQVEPPAIPLFSDSGGRLRAAAARFPGGGRILVHTFVFGALSPEEPEGTATGDLMRRYAAFLTDPIR